jgi:hypothetical protein
MVGGGGGGGAGCCQAIPSRLPGCGRAGCCGSGCLSRFRSRLCRLGRACSSRLNSASLGGHLGGGCKREQVWGPWRGSSVGAGGAAAHLGGASSSRAASLWPFQLLQTVLRSEGCGMPSRASATGSRTSARPVQSLWADERRDRPPPLKAIDARGCTPPRSPLMSHRGSRSIGSAPRARRREGKGTLCGRGGRGAQHVRGDASRRVSEALVELPANWYHSSKVRERHARPHLAGRAGWQAAYPSDSTCLMARCPSSRLAPHTAHSKDCTQCKPGPITSPLATTGWCK